MKAETRFTKRGTFEWYFVHASPQIIPSQRGLVLLRFIVDNSNESLDIKMTTEECIDLIERLEMAKQEAK